MGTWKNDWNDFKQAMSLIVGGFVNVFSVAFVIFIGYMVITNFDDIVSTVTEPFRDEIESVKEAMTDCDKLQEEIDKTKRCLSVPNCTLTKKELAQYDENMEEWYSYCFK